MPRLNIEDQFWLEITHVIEKIGNSDKAIGNAVRWFRFAQEKHRQKQNVSEQEFRLNGFLEELVPHFAIKTEGGFKAVGCDKYFAWLEQKSEAGKRGGSSKSGKKMQALALNRAKRWPKKSEADQKNQNDQNGSEQNQNENYDNTEADQKQIRNTSERVLSSFRDDSLQDQKRSEASLSSSNSTTAVVEKSEATRSERSDLAEQNSAEVFEAGFDPINQALLKLLEPFKLASSYRPHVIALRQRFDTAEELADFIDHVINAKALEKETDPKKPKTVRYLAGALNREIGLSAKKEVAR